MLFTVIAEEQDIFFMVRGFRLFGLEIVAKIKPKPGLYNSTTNIVTVSDGDLRAILPAYAAFTI